MSNDHSQLNVETGWFDENKDSGIMICGINWGGDPSKTYPGQRPSFFSDKEVSNYSYRNRLSRWFELWGHPLEIESGREGPFERSITQTNWLLDRDATMKKRDTFSECKEQHNNFLFHVRVLNPRLIILCGIVLNDVLRSLSRANLLNDEFGRIISSRTLRKDVFASVKKLKRFRVEVDEYEKRTVLALPHPTGSIGLSDNYIAAFKSDVSPIFAEFKKVACYS